MKKVIYGLIVIGLVGCAGKKPMPEGHYQYLSSFAGDLQRCFEKEYISPQTYAQIKGSFSYLVNTWEVDTAKFSRAIDLSYQYSIPTHGDCRAVLARGYELVEEAKGYQTAGQANQEAWNKAIQDMNSNKPIFCNTVGTMTMCN